MKIFKKIALILVSVILSLSTAACSNMSWSVKTADDTLSAGTYIYYMSTAYAEAYSKMENPYGDILSQTIEDKDASTWIKDTAMDSCKRLLDVEKQFSEAGLTLTEDEIAQAESATDSQWKQYGKTYESFGISKDSFHRASSLFSQKYMKLFDYMYGPDGTVTVSDDDLKSYFLKNYVDYSYISKDFFNDESSEMSDEEKVELENKFNSYVDLLNNGKDMKEISETYMSDFSSEEDPLISDVSPIDENTNIPEEVLNALNEMDNNSSKVIKTDEEYYLVHKGNIEEHLDMLENEKDSILANMKSTEYSDMIKQSSESLDITVNKRVINKYQPSMFNKQTSSNK